MVDPDPLQAPLVARARELRRAIAFASVFVVTYALALLATIPASLVFPDSEIARASSGTVWNGRAALNGGSIVEWRWAPLRSLARMAFAVDFTVSGGDSDLAGQALLRPSSVRLDNVAGAADAVLLRAVAPRLPFDCALLMQVDLPHARFGRDAAEATGTIRSGAGSCQPKAAGAQLPTEVPPLILIARPSLAGGTEVRLAHREQRRQVLASMRIERDGRLAIRVTPSGAAVLPFASPPYGLELSTSF